MCQKKVLKSSSADQALVERVNAHPLSAKQMLGLADRITALEPGNRGFEGHAIATVIYFKKHKKRFELTVSAMFRLEALLRIVDEGNLLGWTKDKQIDGSVMTHGALVVAAGQCPIGYSKNKLRFSRKELLRLAFQFAKTPK